MQLNIFDLTQPLSNMIGDIEKGNKCLIIKDGKPIAEILPFKKKKEGWKRKIRKVSLPEKGLVDKYIEEERSLS